MMNSLLEFELCGAHRKFSLFTLTIIKVLDKIAGDRNFYIKDALKAKASFTLCALLYAVNQVLQNK